MNLRRIKHTLLRLSPEEKTIGLGSLAILIGCFIPWYDRTDVLAGKRYIDTAFSGDLGVIGFVVFIMSALSLIVLIAENMHLPFPYLGFKRENLLAFFLGQSAFLTLLTVSIHTKRALEFTDAGLRFGIYLALAGSIFGTFSAFALIRKKQKSEILETLEQAEEINEELAEAVSEMEADMEEELDKMDLDVEMEVEEVAPLHFVEDAETLDSIELSLNEDDEGEKDAKKNNEESSTPKKEEESDPEQGNFFTREAGLEKSKEEGVSESKKNNAFYDDK